MKRLFKQMSVYGLGGIINKAIGFVLLPVYTRVLAPADYGALELVYATGSLIAIAFGLMISSGYIRNYYDSPDESYRQKILESAFWFIVLCCIVLSIPAFMFSTDIAAVIFPVDQGSLYVQLITASTAAQALGTLLYGVLQVREQPKLYVTIQIGTLSVSVILTLWFLIVWELGVPGIIAAQIISHLVETVLLSVKALHRIPTHLSLTALKAMLLFSVPLIPIQISALILNLSDRYFLQAYQSMSEVGLYSLGYRIASLIPLFAIFPLKAFGPYIFSLIQDEIRCKNALADFTRYYVSIVLLIMLTLSLFARELIALIAADNFLDSWHVVFILSMSYFFYGLGNVVSYGFHITKQSWIIGSSWILAAVLNIGLNFVLIPQWSILGASMATLLSFFCVLLVKLFLLRRYYTVPFRHGHIGIAVMVAITIYLLSLPLVTLPISFTFLVKSVLLLLYLSFLLLSGYFSISEIEHGRTLIHNGSRSLYKWLTLKPL